MPPSQDAAAAGGQTQRLRQTRHLAGRRRPMAMTGARTAVVVVAGFVHEWGSTRRGTSLHGHPSACSSRGPRRFLPWVHRRNLNDRRGNYYLEQASGSTAPAAVRRPSSNYITHRTRRGGQRLVPARNVGEWYPDTT